MKQRWLSYQVLGVVLILFTVVSSIGPVVQADVARRGDAGLQRGLASNGVPEPSAVLQPPDRCPHEGDINCDCLVDVTDIQPVANDWRNPNYDPLHDVDRDSDVDIVDVQNVSSRWGSMAAPDLSASTMSVSPEVAERADTLTYTIVMSNTGQCDAAGVVMTDTVPAEVTLIPGSISVTTGTSLATRPLAMSANDGIEILIVWRGTVPVGKPVTVSFQATVNDDVPRDATITNTVEINDGKGNVFVRQATTTVLGQRDLSGSLKSAALTATYASEVLTYTIVLSNTGDADAVEVTLSDIIPVNTTYMTGTAQVQPAGTGVLTDTASSIEWTGTVTHSESVTITFQAEVNRILTSSSVTNTAVISDGKSNTYERSVATVVAGSISGMVTEIDGITPVGGADVYAIEPYGGFGAATTAADGTFTIDNLVQGCYEVLSVASGYVDVALPDVCVVVGQTTANVDLALSFGGGISGTVTQSDGTTPIEGATVFGMEPNGGAGLTNTAAGGTYSLEDLPEGTYEVRASAPGFAQASRSDISVTTGLTTTDVNFALSFGGMISGTVTKDDGVTPIDGATLFATEPGGNSGLATSGPNGSYLLENLAQGTYEVRASAPGFAGASQSNVPVVIGQTTPNVDFALSFGGTISGAVTQIDGTTPISGALVSAIELNGNVGFAATDTDGVYAIVELVASDNYTVTAEATGYAPVSQSGISVTVGQTTPDVDFALAFGGIISGTVTEIDGTTPISGSTVSALASEGRAGSATTAQDGSYTIDELDEDTYEVIASAPGFARSSQADVVVVTGQTTSDVDFSLRAAGWISGSVTTIDGTTPISGTEVSALEPNGGFSYTTTAQDGTYVIADLAPSDDYTVTAQAEGYAPAFQWGVSVTSGQTTPDVDFALSSGGAISGTVTQEDGLTPIAGATVSAAEPNGGLGIVNTAEDGTFLIERLPAANDYAVMVEAQGYARSAQTGVSVTNGQVTPDVDFALSVGGAISGTVTTSDGVTPIDLAIVYAYEVNGGFGITLTIESGDYLIEYLAPADNYTVTVEAEGYISASQTGISVIAGSVTPNINFALSGTTSAAGALASESETIAFTQDIIMAQRDGESPTRGLQFRLPENVPSLEIAPGRTSKLGAAEGCAEDQGPLRTASPDECPPCKSQVEDWIRAREAVSSARSKVNQLENERSQIEERVSELWSDVVAAYGACEEAKKKMEDNDDKELWSTVGLLTAIGTLNPITMIGAGAAWGYYSAEILREEESAWKICDNYYTLLGYYNKHKARLDQIKKELENAEKELAEAEQDERDALEAAERCWDNRNCPDGIDCTDDECVNGSCIHKDNCDKEKGEYCDHRQNKCVSSQGGASLRLAYLPEGSTTMSILAYGGALRSNEGAVIVTFPAGAVFEPTKAVYMPQAKTFISGFAPVRFFSLEAYREGGWQKVTRFNKPVTIQVSYAAADVAGLDESKLGLYYFDTTANQWVGLPSTVEWKTKP